MMDELARLRIEHACAKLPYLFAKYADNGDHASLAALFTENCEFARPFQPDHPFFGRERVQAIFRNRPPILVRHIVSNVLVEPVSETEARGTSYLAMLSCHTQIEGPAPAGGLYVGGFEDRYVRIGEQWLFKSRHGHVALHQGGDMPQIPPPSDEARGVS